MDSPATLAQQASTSLERGDIATAERLVTHALQQFAGDPDVQRSAGLLRMQQGRLAEAVKHLGKAVELNPGDAVAQNYLGETLFLSGNLPGAESCFRDAAASDSEFARPWANLGTLSLAQDQHQVAETAFSEALARDPKSAEALLGMGNLADGAGRFDEAVRLYERTLDAQPRYRQAMQNLAVLNFRLGNTSAAINGLKKALRMLPKDPHLCTTLGLVRLMSGQWRKAWDDYAARLTIPPVSQNPWASWLTLWDGRALNSEGVVVWTEQGLGDFIVALHALPDLQSKASKIVLACDMRLEPILARSFPEISVIAPFDIGASALGASNVKYHAPAFELIRHAYRTPEEIPERAPWLKSNAEGRQTLRRRYEGKAQGRPIIGVTWQSRKSIHGNDSSVSLLDLADTLRRVDGFYVSLQYGDTEADLNQLRETAGLNIFQDPEVDQLKDMDSFVDQVSALDAVLATGSTAVHVAGALHVPVTVLSYDRGDGLIWHRFTDRRDSPWYPTMRILRWNDRPALTTALDQWAP